MTCVLTRDRGLCADQLVRLLCLGRIVLDRQRINPDVAVDKKHKVRLWHSCPQTDMLAYNAPVVLKGAIIEFVAREWRKGGGHDADYSGGDE